jgi:hypothetical protein
MSSAPPLPPASIRLGELEAIAAEVWPGCGEFIAERSAAVVKIVATLYGEASVVTAEEAARIRELAACRGLGGRMLGEDRAGGPRR